MMSHQTVIVLDFGGQYNQLIARRVRECGVYCEVKPYTTPLEQLRAMEPIGFIFTGGPNSVYEAGAPKADPAIFELGVPVLGICYGCQFMAHALGGQVTEAHEDTAREYGKTETYYDTACKLFKGLPEQGITWIDTAPIYGLGHSETVVGQALRRIGRDKVILSSKCGLEWRHETPVLHKVVDGVTVYRDLSAQSIIEDVEDSLRRLGTDHLDVLYTHWQSPDFGLYPLEETVEAMTRLKQQGKIRAIGASNVTADILRRYCQLGQLDVIQEKYSLLTRRIEKQLMPACKELGVSVQAYSPLEQGLLTGKVTMDTTYPEGSTRNANPNFQPARRAQALALLESWQDLTKEYDCTLSQLVIALTARLNPGLHILCGARTPQQALDNAKALQIRLSGPDAVRMRWDLNAIS